MGIGQDAKVSLRARWNSHRHPDIQLSPGNRALVLLCVRNKRLGHFDSPAFAFGTALNHCLRVTINDTREPVRWFRGKGACFQA